MPCYTILCYYVCQEVNMEIQEGGSKYKSQIYNAYWNNAHLDTRFRLDKDAVGDAVNHLCDCKENPTVGLLLRKKYRTNNYPDCFHRNLNLLYCDDRVQRAQDSFELTYNTLYPKTGKARKYLIKNENVVFNYVKPIQKGLKRSLFKLFSKII